MMKLRLILLFALCALCSGQNPPPYAFLGLAPNGGWAYTSLNTSGLLNTTGGSSTQLHMFQGGYIPPVAMYALNPNGAWSPLNLDGSGNLKTTSSGGGGSGTVNAASQYALTCYLNSGSVSIVSGCLNINTDSSGDLILGASLTVVGSISTGTAPTACGSATGCFGATFGSTASTQTSGQGSFRGDSTSGNWLIREENGTAEYAATITIASGTAALGTNSISSGACATVVTVAGTGILSTDSITWTPNGSIKAVTGYAPSTSGGLSIAPYPTSGNVNFDVCNWSANPITPGAVTLNWRVTR